MPKSTPSLPGHALPAPAPIPTSPLSIEVQLHENSIAAVRAQRAAERLEAELYTPTRNPRAPRTEM